MTDNGQIAKAEAASSLFFISSDPNFKPRPKWSTYTLILPSITLGNVPQLTCDILLSTLGLKRMAYLNSDALLPCAGCDAFTDRAAATGELTTGAEVFESDELRLVVVQFRGGLIQGRRRKLASQLTEWVRSCNFRRTVLLQSRDAATVGGATALERYHVNDYVPNEDVAQLDALSDWQKTVEEAESSSSKGLIFNSLTAAKLPCVLVASYVAEGDNTADALRLATYLNKWFAWISVSIHPVASRIAQPRWQQPASWKNMFGRMSTKLGLF